MSIKKKCLSFVTMLALVICFVSACGSNGNNSGKSTGGVSGSAASGEKKISIVTTIFPEYDWVKQILGDQSGNVELTMLLDKGVDLHSYQPTAQDMMKIATCDLFIYVGGESDEWVEDALKEAVNKDMKVVNLLEMLGNSVKEEEVVEGMEGEEEEGEEEEEGPEYDEHVWLSLKNAQTLCSGIAKELSALDTANAGTYEKNAAAYNDKLAALDAEYKAVADKSSVKTILFGDRFPFRYLADDYDLSYYAAFVGCSAETEASFETVTFLAKKVDELGLKVIFTIEGQEHKIAETIRENTKEKNQEIVVMDSMQSTTSADVESGATYLDIMTKNLDSLKSALE